MSTEVGFPTLSICAWSGSDVNHPKILKAGHRFGDEPDAVTAPQKAQTDRIAIEPAEDKRFGWIRMPRRGQQ